MPEQDARSSAVDAELDRLFQAPPAAFVSERNKLVQSLRRSGDRATADAVARLQRPSPVAFSVNQLHFRAPDVMGALLYAGKALREAQESMGGTDTFADRKRAHQAALREATDRALELAEEGGVSNNASFKRRAEMTLSLLSAAATPVEPPPGRMCAELEPVGFDALAGMELGPPPPKAPKRAAPATDPARLERVQAVKTALDAANGELRRLEREAEYRESLHDRAARDAADAEQRAEAARKARDEARGAADEARERMDAARRAVEGAERALRELET